MNKLPQEIISLIFLETDFETCIKNGRLYEANKLFDPEKHNWLSASSNGHLEVVKFLHEHRKEGCTTNAMDLASREGHLEIVKFLHEHRKEGCTTRAMNWASLGGHLEIVKFLHEHRKEG